MGKGNWRPTSKTLMAPVRDRNDLKHKGFTISVEVSEGMDFLYITLWVSSVYPGHDPVIRFVPQFHLLRVDRPRGFLASSSILFLGLLWKTGWSTTCRTLLLGCFRHYRRLHSGLLVFTNPGWVRFERQVPQIWLGNGFLDTRGGPVNPDLYFATLTFILRRPFLGSPSSRG